MDPCSLLSLALRSTGSPVPKVVSSLMQLHLILSKSAEVCSISQFLYRCDADPQIETTAEAGAAKDGALSDKAASTPTDTPPPLVLRPVVSRDRQSSSSTSASGVTDPIYQKADGRWYCENCPAWSTNESRKNKQHASACVRKPQDGYLVYHNETGWPQEDSPWTCTICSYQGIGRSRGRGHVTSTHLNKS